MEPTLLDAYRRTAFIAYTSMGRVVLRIGKPSADLDALLSSTGVATWAYITACNPGSVRVTDGQNLARQRELEQVITARGCVSYRGDGIGDDGDWPAEPSLLILGIARDEAVQLGRRFGQLAVVCGERGHEVELVVCEQAG
jgi:hypothetical protein